MKLTLDEYHRAVKRWMNSYDRLPYWERCEDAHEGDPFGYFEQLVMDRVYHIDDIPQCYVTPSLRKR
mgnify:CR=1 FL=1